MRPTPSERDRLLLFTTAELARSRRARGLRLNVPEAIALVADTAAEVARDGRRLPEAITAGQAVLGPADAPGAVLTDDPQDLGGGVPPEDVVTVEVVNTAAVPISVTSHFHFFEANPHLRFDRAAAYGRHLAIPAVHPCGSPRAAGRRSPWPRSAIGGSSSASPGWSTARSTLRAAGSGRWSERGPAATWEPGRPGEPAERGSVVRAEHRRPGPVRRQRSRRGGGVGLTARGTSSSWLRADRPGRPADAGGPRTREL
jgi:urease subunit gamma/beta